MLEKTEKMDETKFREIQLSSEEVYNGKMLQIYKDRVLVPNGRESVREYIKYIGAVAVVPVNEKNEVAVERQFRYPIDQVVTEIPAGKLNSADEDRLEAAKRELKEETGLVADIWEPIGDYYPASAYTNERITMFMARGLHQEEREPDEDEFINVEFVPIEKLVEDIITGKITDGKTEAGIMKAAWILTKMGK